MLPTDAASVGRARTIMKSKIERGHRRRHASKALRRVCVASVAFFGFVSPASADMVTVTYIGTVHDGFDQLGRIIHGGVGFWEVSGD
jgi:hypothetical protein